MTCNEKCIHRTVCELKKYDFAYIVDCKHYEEPKPQGEWIIVKDDRHGDNVKCPFCGKELAGTDLNFCCKCGAELIGSEKMNVEADNGNVF